MSIAIPFVTRALATWAVTRLCASAFALASGGGASGGAPFALAPMAAVLLVGVATTLCLIDVGRRREAVLLGNFGVSRARLVLWCAAPATLGELLLGAASEAWP
jgi:hypothetical protein